MFIRMKVNPKKVILWKKLKPYLYFWIGCWYYYMLQQTFISVKKKKKKKKKKNLGWYIYIILYHMFTFFKSDVYTNYWISLSINMFVCWRERCSTIFREEYKEVHQLTQEVIDQWLWLQGRVTARWVLIFCKIFFSTAFFFILMLNRYSTTL